MLRQIDLQRITMFKIGSLLSPAVLLSFLLIGCNEPQPLDNSSTYTNEWAKQSNKEDIDISDLEENLTQSQMLMSQEGGYQMQERIAFPTNEYYRLAKMGKGTIKGKIYLQDAYGHIAGANTRLYLNPVTSYSNQWYKQSYLGGYKMTQADPRLFNYLKFTASNEKGAFAFYGVPSGEYYLIGTVKCAQECGYATTKSIRIARRVSITGNQVIEQDLSRAIE